MSEQQLSGMLSSMKISNNSGDVNEIVALAKGSNGNSGHHYGLACQKHFDLTHPDHLKMGLHGSDNVALHPNQWFQASVQYYNVKTGKATATATSAAITAAGAESLMDVEAAPPAAGGLNVVDSVLDTS